MKVAGIMSGTSLDGIDIALVEIQRRKFTVETFRSFPYPARVRQALLAVSNSTTHTSEISRLNFLLPELYAAALRKTCAPATIQLIGCHGQTIFHNGASKSPSTLQIGDGSVLAALTGVPVVSDFRPADMAVGGKGAPLVPFVDYMLFRDPKRGRVALNIGGIANLTAIPPGAQTDQVIAFDTGPGNMVIDALAFEYTNGRQTFDRGGRLASQGKVDSGLLRSLTADSYYRSKPPKTAGREQYGAEFIQRLKNSGLPALDLIATVTALTPATIALALECFVPFTPGDLIVSGGGVHNPEIMSLLASLLPGVAVSSSEVFAINPDAKEAIAFAVLAYETWHGRPSNLPSATGASRPAILGKLSRP